MADPTLLNVEKLSVRFPSDRGPVEVVHSISFAMGAEKLGLVGESGSGKSMTARALIGLVAKPGRVTADRLTLDGEDLTALTPRQWKHWRGSKIGLVLQDPKFALDPVMSIGRQVEEPLKLHTTAKKAERRERALAMLEAVGLPDPLRAYHSYPHQLSGGMGQRVMLAATLIAEPRLLIADEPTSALDRDLRDQVLDLMLKLVDERQMGLILISHDLDQVARFCDRALVMYRGDIVDRLPAAELANSEHPYTKTLWACRPSPETFGTLLPTLDRVSLGAGA
jgi:peptide/nickel transport system ATP-binding protein